MSKFKIAYIDESEVDIRRFQRFSYNFFEVVPITPVSSIEETCNLILDNHVDAIVADFDLSEQDPTIHYDGTDLIRLILNKMEKFPVFILTSFEDDAISKGEDVNIVYEKKEMDQGENFLVRIKIQIEKYKHKIEKDENRLLQLIEQNQQKKLDAFEIQELAELDSKIERSLDSENQIPNILRDDRETSELSILLQQVDLLSKILENKR